MITVYGIPNCDTVKKSRDWLQAQNLAFVFHDFKKQGVPKDRLNAWIQACGWEAVINRKGTSWRALPDERKAAVCDATSACAVALLQPSVIKRPVVEWADGSITVGFTPERFAEQGQRGVA